MNIFVNWWKFEENLLFIILCFFNILYFSVFKVLINEFYVENLLNCFILNGFFVIVFKFDSCGFILLLFLVFIKGNILL